MTPTSLKSTKNELNFVKTIGVLEASYVIHKLLESQRIPSLTIYLEAIEENGFPHMEHRNLLISCYAKTKDETKLRKLLNSSKSIQGQGQPMDGAVEILLHSGFIDIALNFAKKFSNHELAVQILTEYTQVFNISNKYRARLRIAQSFFLPSDWRF